MRRRIFILVTALALVVALAVGALYAVAATPVANPTIKVIVVYKSRSDGKAIVRELAARDSAGIYQFRLIPAVAATVSRSTLEALRADANVAGVYPDRKIAPPVDPAGPEGLSPAGKPSGAAASGPIESEALQLTHAQDAWKITVKGQAVMGQGIRVGLTDSGIDRTHPDLAAAIEDYRDFTGTDLQDRIGHGTACASCVAAQGLPVFNSYTGTTMRYAGMAPKAKILMAKVGDLGGGLDSQFIRGIEWLVDERVDIISDSWACSGIPQDGSGPVAMAVEAAIEAGITYCVSAGNDGPGQGTVLSPGVVPGALTVGASTGNREFSQIRFLTHPGAYKGDQVVPWSSRGPNALGAFKPDIMALGAYGWALAPMAGDDRGNAGIQGFSGTSMAAPVCAGDLALAQCAWKLAHPGRRLPAPSYWKNLLASTTTDLGYPALDQSSGLVNAEAAVKAVLGRGASMLVSVAGDAASPANWSVRLGGGARASTTVSVVNTGDTTERISLTPLAFVADESETITREITLQKADGYLHTETIEVPGGAQFVEARLTWPSGPRTAIGTAIYDSVGDFIAYSPIRGGYGHLALTQVSLTGPADQRPVVTAGAPWRLDIFPSGSQRPTGETQVVHLQVKFFHKATWPALTTTRSRLTLRPGQTAKVRATVRAPAAAGTSFGGLVVSNGATRTTIPVAVRVPVKVSNGRGKFGGIIRGSGFQYQGGEWGFFDFTVPRGTGSIAASVTWPDQGNVFNLYLVDPSGTVRDAKGGDLFSSDFPLGLVPAAAFTHTAEQVIWDSPDPGAWQLLVWAPAFSGDALAEPFTGVIKLAGNPFAGVTWKTVAGPGATLTRDFTVTDPGPTSLDVYAESQSIWNGRRQSRLVKLDPITGTLRAGADEFQAIHELEVPQNVSLLTCSAIWQSAPGTLVDVSLYDPTWTDRANASASTDTGNCAQVGDPMAGTWYVVVSYGDPRLPAPTAAYTLTVDYVAPTPVVGFSSSAARDDPLTLRAGGSGTINATIRVPADAWPGDVIEGRVDFYTVSGGIEVAGGDRLGSVPISITVQ
jgi:hypothetical protein